jgi:hypothetical protein
VGERIVAIVNDRPPLMHAVHPDAGLGNVIVLAFSLRRTHVLERVGGPGLERKCPLIGLDQVIKTYAASGEGFRFIQSGLGEFFQGMRLGKFEQPEAGMHYIFRSLPFGDAELELFLVLLENKESLAQFAQLGDKLSFGFAFIHHDEHSKPHAADKKQGTFFPLLPTPLILCH